MIERWSTHPFDLCDPYKRFKKSNFNYFLKDPQNGIVIGYWDAEDGYEDLGEEGFHEIIHVMEGRLFVMVNGREEIAHKGDTVVIKNGQHSRIIVRGHVKALFVCYAMDDVEEYEENVRRKCRELGF